MSSETIKKSFSNYGKYDLLTTEYQRFRADKKKTEITKRVLLQNICIF